MRSFVCVAVLVLGCAASSEAATDCVFDVSGTSMRLTADCWTDESIVIPDGMTLDGLRHTITAVDPASGGFKGGVVVNGGATASIINTNISGALAAVVCHPSAPVDLRLRGILFNAASGAIRGNRVIGVAQPASGCQEGNAIEVRNFVAGAPTSEVDIVRNVVDDYQKGGIIANGNVDVRIRQNWVGASATQANLAANAVQIGFGGLGVVEQNVILGNSWAGPSDYAAAGVLLYDSAAGTAVRHNLIGGNADVGIYIYADQVRVESNVLYEASADTGLYDIGIGNYGADNVVRRNRVHGYDTPFEGVEGGGNESF